jgi:hypothetical protein
MDAQDWLAERGDGTDRQVMTYGSKGDWIAPLPDQRNGRRRRRPAGRPDDHHHAHSGTRPARNGRPPGGGFSRPAGRAPSQAAAVRPRRRAAVPERATGRGGRGTGAAGVGDVRRLRGLPRHRGDGPPAGGPAQPRVPGRPTARAAPGPGARPGDGRPSAVFAAPRARPVLRRLADPLPLPAARTRQRRLLRPHPCCRRRGSSALRRRRRQGRGGFAAHVAPACHLPQPGRLGAAPGHLGRAGPTASSAAARARAPTQRSCAAAWPAAVPWSWSTPAIGRRF